MSGKNAKTVSEAAQTPAENTETGIVTNDQYPSWYVEKVDRRTGELQMVPKYKYLEGLPKEYRFDGRVGTFGLVSGGGAKSLKLRPIAHRFFEDDILGQKERKTWGEIFFIDDTNAVAAILFHTHSLRNLQEVIAPLFYDDLMLEDVILTCTSEKMESKKWNPDTKTEDKFTYFLAKFAFEEAPIEEVNERIAFANSVRLYRRQTATAEAVVSASSRYFDIFLNTPHMEEAEPEDEGTGAEVEL
jgi:hypothetical protein